MSFAFFKNFWELPAIRQRFGPGPRQKKPLADHIKNGPFLLYHKEYGRMRGVFVKPGQSQKKLTAHVYRQL
jgi:hypothetical protein